MSVIADTGIPLQLCSEWLAALDESDGQVATGLTVSSESALTRLQESIDRMTARDSLAGSSAVQQA